MVPTTVRASLVTDPATLLKDGLYDQDSKSASRVFFIILVGLPGLLHHTRL